LRRLRVHYPETLVIIGVHSAKFPTEKRTENIRAAVMRLGIEHPVVNDADFDVWSQYAVRAWPTVVLVDPAGKVVGQQAGEIDAEEFIPVIDALLADFDQRGLLDHTPFAGLAPESLRAPGGLLRYPAKLLVHTGDRLYVADTGHHRVLEVQLSLDGLSGEIVRVFGTGEAGLRDGHVREAQFHAPHGMALRGSRLLYVADTENHAVRAIDLVREQVNTVAGTGQKGTGRWANGSEPVASELRSPWALAALDELLFIAMAGAHQIWVLIQEQKLGVFAGTGAEALVDGPRAEAAFNQPSDLVLALGHLFVADAEASAIRAISLENEMQVFTLVGQGLFEFGDVDGKGAMVRLQHPTGLAKASADSGLDERSRRLIYLTDSYNHKVKTLDPTTGDVQSLIGSGEPGWTDGPFAHAKLFEPEGLAFNRARLYIADTNNHQIRVADLATRTIQTLTLL
jgi:hypothetical protein